MRAISDGRARLQVQSVLVGPDGTVFAGARNGGVWRSSDRGTSWTGPNETMEGVNVTALAQAPDNANILYASTRDSTSRGGVHKSTDGGLNWTDTGLQQLANTTATPFPEVPLWTTIAVHPLNSNRVYVGGR